MSNLLPGLRRLVHAALLVLLSGVAPWVQAAAAADAEPRVALVIGNAAYSEGSLRNPVNDAREMARTLRGLGFKVLAHENLTKKALEAAVLEFGRQIAEGGVGLFFYAGHGMQVRGRNYLVPVDAKIPDEASTRVAAVDIDLLLEQMASARNRVNLVILDACRNNPFERKLRGTSQGLAAVDAARGTLVAYATAPGSVAADGEGEHGLYTDELLKALRVPGLKVEEVFKRVRIAVGQRSKGAQTPWESSSLTGDLVVNVNVQVVAPAAPATATAAPAALSADRDALFWASIKDSKDPEGYRAYLKQFPDGTFAELARQRIASATAAGTVATPAPGVAALQPPLPGPIASALRTSTQRFDGTWDLRVACEGVPGKAAAYEMQFPVEVRDGEIAGRKGGDTEAGSLGVIGRIRPDGSATVAVRGLTGDPKFSIDNSSRGTPYGYRANGRFGERHGTALRADRRTCTLDFARR